MLVNPKYWDEDKKYGRDPGVSEMIRYLEAAEHRKHALNRKEREAIGSMTEACIKDFHFAARNFFWITDKRGRDILFKLWPSQELLLEIMAGLRARGRAQKVILLKARQLGFSSLIEAKIAWRTMFFPNVDALVVSDSSQSASYLFNKMLHIYGRMPWWLRPMVASYKFEGGLWFENPDEEQRHKTPGLNSKVIVQEATQRTAIAQSMTLRALHASEFSSWPQETARQAIIGDIPHALAEQDPDMFAVLESTGHGAGSFAHKLWLQNMDLGDQAHWHPVFFPVFMEKTRVLAPPQGWIPEEPEIKMREQAGAEWVLCDNAKCNKWRPSTQRRVSIIDTMCPACNVGTLKPYRLSDDQLCWLQQQRVNAKDEASFKIYKEELAMTATDCWQAPGLSVFPIDVRELIARLAAHPRYAGKLDERGLFHAVANHETRQCYQEWCTVDHSFEINAPMEVWEPPKLDARYFIGVDVSGGNGGEADYSVVWINRLGDGPNPDVQVAKYRSNEIAPYELAGVVNFLGRWYNEAEVAVEYNTFQTVGDNLLQYYVYPAVFKWRWPETGLRLSKSFHFVTNSKTKPLIVQNLIRYIRQKMFIPRSHNFAGEINNFRKEYIDAAEQGAPTGLHDDEVMACAICLYCAHFTESADNIDIPRPKVDLTPETAPIAMSCDECNGKWGVESMDELAARRCPQCGNRRIRGRRNGVNPNVVAIDWQEMETSGVDSRQVFDYDAV